jgi:predicted RNA binding protein YcfA (HicA-like mRNA interferase family)
VVKVRAIIRAVEAAGWVYDRTVGDHRQYVRPGQLGVVTIAGALSDDLQEGTLNRVCRDAGIDKERLKGRRR